jgi:ubiquinone/menaquinone biosynthesis C-methylase UbiE
VSNGPHPPHERRYAGGADRLRAPQRVALLETARVVSLSVEGLPIESVLDVGTGTGLFAEAFADGSRRVDGIDPEAGLLEVARRLVPAAGFREGTAESVPFPERSFDLVFFGHVLHETDDPVRALTEARRVARRRVVVLEFPYRNDEMGPPLAHRLSPSRVLELAAAAGFSKTERIELDHMDLYRLEP